MVFLLAYTPCVATLSAQRRELGMRWTAFGVGLQLVVAWTLAVLVFQVWRVFW
jgi:ferrous iron transport protein B